jgi:hypothetical protein
MANRFFTGLIGVGMLLFLVLSLFSVLAYDYVYVDDWDEDDYDMVFLRRPDMLEDKDPDFYVYERPSQTKYIHLRDDYWVETSWDEPTERRYRTTRNQRDCDGRDGWGRNYDRERYYDRYPSNPIKDHYYEYSPYMRKTTRKECYHSAPDDSWFYIKCP